MAVADVKSRLIKLDERLADLVPPRATWNPVDEALYKPADLYRVPIGEAQQMQRTAIRYAFAHHYNHNKFYHKYCREENVRPDDLKTVDDLNKIPLISDATFKQYPSGKDFARWLATIFTGDLPQIVIKGANPTFDDVINAFNAAGLAVMFSSGTSGRLTAIPRDMKTFVASEYAFAKAVTSMLDIFAGDGLMCFPRPTTSLFLAKMLTVIAQQSARRQYALDIDIPAELTQMAMSRETKPKAAANPSSQSEMLQRIVSKTVQWLEHQTKTNEKILLTGPPFLLFNIMSTLEQADKRFEFGERAQIGTGGGWKAFENARIPGEAFRKRAQDVLGIPEMHCIDVYGMCEANGYMVQCPEGHYLHATYTYFKPIILDEDLIPVGYG
jgi:long-chain-fatty-acid---luciferin-component ligase